MLAATIALLFTAGAQSHVYFGNLHSHTSYSDGSGTPTEAYAHARDVAKLDFLAITEHNHSQAESGAGDRIDGKLIATNHALYTGDLIPAATAATAPGSFIALYGQEFSSISKGNHVNVFEIADVIDEAQVPNGDFKKLDTWLNSHLDSTGHPALMQFNHPALLDNDNIEYGRDDFGSVPAWLTAMDKHAGLIEVLNGPAMSKGDGEAPADIMEADFLTYLNRGFHLAPSGDQDNHYKTWGSVTDARTAVVATELTKAAILEGLRARHVYATEDKNLRVIATVNAHLMGDRTSSFPAAGIELAIGVEIADDDEPSASYKIEVYSDDHAGGSEAQVAETFNEPHAGTFQLSGVNFTGAGQYVFLKITQSGSDEDTHKDRVWTAPVWFDAAPIVVPTITMHLDSIVPNPAGSDAQFEAATIHNFGTQPASMVGWTLRDATGNTWKLDGLGTLAANQAKTIRRNGQPMSMNNNGGEVIQLVSPASAVVDEIRYESAAIDQVILHPAP